jgi:GATA-binding protein, other eukaryote
MQAPDSATAAALAAVRRTSQHKANGHDDTNSPVSRTGTPAIYDPHLPVFNGIDGHQYQSPALPQYPAPGGSPGRPTSPMNGEAHLDIPDTREQLIAANSSLKTRVSELEVIQDLYRGRLSQLEQDQQTQDNFRHQAEEAMKAEVHERQIREEIQRKHEETQRQLDDSHRRENILKRRLDEMEQELKEALDKVQKLEQDAAAEEERPAKKPRIEEEIPKDASKEAPKEEVEAVPTPKSSS